MYIYLVLFLCTSIGIYEYFQVQEKISLKQKEINLEQEKIILEQKKMYDIIMSKGSIDKDPYNRTISEFVVKKFYSIAKKYSIKLDTITDNEFDFIYKKYIKYQIHKNNKT